MDPLPHNPGVANKQNALPLLKDLWEAVEARPYDFAAVNALGAALWTRGEIKHAAGLFERAVRINPTSEAAIRNRAQTLLAMGQVLEAVGVLRDAVVNEPMPMAAARDLAFVLLDLGQHEEAKELFTFVTGRMRDLGAVVGLCGCCLSGQPWRAAAREAASLMGDPFREEALYPLVGRALFAAGSLNEAKECFQQVLASTPEDPVSLQAMGDVAFAEQANDLGLQYHSRAYSQKPNDPGAALVCMKDHLAAGRYADARRIFRSKRRAICSRWGHGSHYSSRAPEWDGSPLKGKVILIHGSVGLGDTIQYSRLLNLLKEEGGTVVLEVPTALRSLMRSLTSADFVVCKYDPLPAIPLDFECDLREIFLLRNVPMNAIGLSVPYIFPSLGARRRWARFVLSPGCLKIGIVWEGGRLLHLGALARRSMPLDSLRPLAEISDANLFSLQIGPGSTGLESKPWAKKVIDLSAGMHNFTDTTAIISLLDVVVTIDTSVAHLAGAMGKRTFLMLPRSVSWRWQINSEESIWYPSMRLFRMGETGGWEGVVTRVKTALLRLEESK